MIASTLGAFGVGHPRDPQQPEDLALAVAELDQHGVVKARRARCAPVRRRGRSSGRQPALGVRRRGGRRRCRCGRPGHTAHDDAREPRARPPRQQSRPRTAAPTARVGGISRMQAEDVGDESGGQQERAADDDQDAVEDLPVRNAPRGQRVLEVDPRAAALPAQQPRADDRVRRSGAGSSTARRSPARPG